MKRSKRKLELRAEHVRRIDPTQVSGGVMAYTTTGDEACSGPCCTKVTVSWCAKGGE